MDGISLVTLIIIVLNGLMSIKGFNDYSFFHQYKFSIREIQMGQKVRFFTSGFLHVDTTHLAVNMLTLYFFADMVIFMLGTIPFLAIYIGSLLIGNVVSYAFHKNEPSYTAVGASGAVIGVLYSAILLRPDMMLGLFFIIPIPAYVFGVGYLLYSIWAMKKRNDNIGHDAHLGGAMGGYFLTLLIQPSLLFSSLFMVVLLAVPILILFFYYKNKR